MTTATSWKDLRFEERIPGCRIFVIFIISIELPCGFIASMCTVLKVETADQDAYRHTKGARSESRRYSYLFLHPPPPPASFSLSPSPDSHTFDYTWDNTGENRSGTKRRRSGYRGRWKRDRERWARGRVKRGKRKRGT